MMNGKLIRQSFKEAIYTLTSLGKMGYFELVLCAILSMYFYLDLYIKGSSPAIMTWLILVSLSNLANWKKFFRGYKLLPMNERELYKFDIFSSIIFWGISVAIVTFPTVIGLCVKKEFGLIIVPFFSIMPSKLWVVAIQNFRDFKLNIIHKVIDVSAAIGVMLWVSYCFICIVSPWVITVVGIAIYVVYFAYHYFRIRKYTIDELNFEGILNSKSPNLTGGPM